MVKDTLDVMTQGALNKKKMMEESLLRYLVAAALAGGYVGLGIVLIFRVGGILHAGGSIYTTMLMGMSFGVALTLVIFAGSELFTGNNMFYTISTLSKATTWKDTLYNWVWCYAGNLLGALVLCLLIVGSGIFNNIPENHLLMNVAKMKMELGFSELFFRGILCNWFVCLAIWTSMRTKNDAAKLILIWWMLYGFIASGYEHSIANMTVLSLSLMLPHPETITMAGWFHNLIPVTLGNIVGGGLFVGFMYWYVSGKKKTKAQEQPVVQEAPVQAATPQAQN
ncbi:formate/nitrite transporter family protein [Marinicrinis sediminis]|uniref:Formate/nitrite transporter family protein n=1 Tax=Marinicrinis sediminis TaxID=1652465 RepID=A0ABW5R8E9_9BACL